MYPDVPSAKELHEDNTRPRVVLSSRINYYIPQSNGCSTRSRVILVRLGERVRELLLLRSPSSRISTPIALPHKAE